MYSNTLNAKFKIGVEQLQNAMECLLSVQEWNVS